MRIGVKLILASAAPSTIVLALLVGAGCQTPQPSQNSVPKPKEIDAERVETHDDVVDVKQFWPQVPWLTRRGEPVGLQVRVYFQSAALGKGAFVPGTIFVWLYTVESRTSAQPVRKLAYMWQYDEAQALNFRITKLSRMGYSYGLLLTWPPELDLRNQYVEVEIGYQRLDGKLVQAPSREFRVPAGGSARQHGDSFRSQPPATGPTTRPQSPGRGEPRPDAPASRPAREPA